MPGRCIFVPQRTGASLPTTCPAPTWPSCLNKSGFSVKGALCMDLSRAREGLLGGQMSGLLLLSLPHKHWPGHSSRLPSWERVKQIRSGRSCRERVWTCGSGKKEMCADLASPVVGLLGHIAPLAGAVPFPPGTKHFVLFSARAQQESLQGSLPPSQTWGGV